VSITRSPDSTRSGPGAAPGPGRPRGGLRLAGFQVRLTLGAQLLAMLTVLAGAFILPDLAPGLPAVAYLAATAVLVIGFLASLIAHELAHAVVARRYGATAEQIRVGFFGGTAHGRHEYATPRGLWRAAAAGPACSLILAAASVGAALGLIGLGAGRLPVAVFAAFAWINIVLAVLHLLPGAGLDGGRLIQALAWARSGDRARATITAARVAQIAGALLIAGGVAALAFGYLDGIWPGLIGLVMISTARAQAREVQAITALSFPTPARPPGPSRAGIRCSHSSMAVPGTRPADRADGWAPAARRPSPCGTSRGTRRDCSRSASWRWCQRTAVPSCGLWTWPPRLPRWSPPRPMSRWGSCSPGCPSVPPPRPPCTRPGTRWCSPRMAPRPGC
jgi:Zn-dependent protease